MVELSARHPADPAPLPVANDVPVAVRSARQHGAEGLRLAGSQSPCLAVVSRFAGGLEANGKTKDIVDRLLKEPPLRNRGESQTHRPAGMDAGHAGTVLPADQAGREKAR